MANEEIENLRRQYQQHPSSQHVVIDNYTLYEMDEKNPRHWSLVARRGEMLNHDQVRLTAVKMEYYDQNTIKMKLVAPEGDADASTKYVMLTGIEGKPVEATGAGGKATLRAGRIELMNKNQFVASGSVNIEWPGVAKVNGDKALGRIDLSDFKDFKIVGHTHAQIMVN